MTLCRTFTALLMCAAVSTTTIAAPPEGKGGGKGGGGGDDPPAEPFMPSIAYLEEGRKSIDLKLANRAGDQACLVLRSESGARIRGFVYHAASKVLAYSIPNIGIQLATWVDDPCVVGAGTLIGSGGDTSYMDFSPDGNLLAWTEPDPGYTGFGTSSLVFVYDVGNGTLTQLDLEQWGGDRPEWGVYGEWSTGSVRFSPDFSTTNELLFSGGPLDGSQGAYNSLFAYNIDETEPPRKYYDGAGDGIDSVMSVTNPTGTAEARIAITQGPVRQIAISDGSEGPTFDGYEPAYSCDNSELVHRFRTNGGKYEIRITSADGGSTETWSKGKLRFFDWFCP